MPLFIRGWSRAACSSLQSSFPFFMHCEMAEDECNLSSLQVQYSQGKRTSVTENEEPTKSQLGVSTTVV